MNEQQKLANKIADLINETDGGLSLYDKLQSVLIVIYAICKQTGVSYHDLMIQAGENEELMEETIDLKPREGK